MKFYWPLQSVTITQKFGNKSKAYAIGYHMGVDLHATKGTPVFAAQAGKVVVAKSSGVFDGYGSHVTIDHGNGIFSIYAHLDEVLVVEGQYLFIGQLLGKSGGNAHDYPKPKTGYTKAGFSTAPHLHYELDNGAIGASHSINPTPITFSQTTMADDPNFVPDWAQAALLKARKKGFTLPDPNTSPKKFEIAAYFDKLGLLDKMPDKAG